jgi:selenium metabolism protein YedF
MTFLYLNSDKMGSGDPALGSKLMLAFLKNLAASQVEVDLVGCVNDGVQLTRKGSPALDHLKALEAKGATIASCGTCLEHLGIENELAIGVVGKMEQTIEVMATADRILRV